MQFTIKFIKNNINYIMSISHLYSTSYLITNLGCEMIYVLSSRLKAQEIPHDKSEKVINDVIHSLFESSFLTKINSPQRIDKLLSFKSLFEKLAHSSIMKLNETSMNKLFDLILMTMKLLILRMRTPEELITITNNHLQTIIQILKTHLSSESKKSIDLIQCQLKFYNSLFCSFSSWDFVVLKRNLLRFFQGKNVKVSIFMNEDLQSENGCIKLPLNDPCAVNVKQTGEVSIYNNGSVVKSYFVDLMSSVYYLKGFEKNVRDSYANLGMNIFLVDPKIKISFQKQYQSEEINKEILISTVNESNKSLKMGKSDESQGDQIKKEEKEGKSNKQIQKNLKLNEGESISYLNNKERITKIDNIKREFNSLASILNVKQEENEDEIFELNFNNDNDLIDVYHKKDNKFINEFNYSNHLSNDEDDLLDMMDKAVLN